MEAHKHLAIVRGRLALLSGRLAETPGQASATELVGGLPGRFDGQESPDSEPTERSIEIDEFAKHPTGIPGAFNVLVAIRAARADGTG